MPICNNSAIKNKVHKLYSGIGFYITRGINFYIVTSKSNINEWMNEMPLRACWSLLIYLVLQ